MTRDHWKAQQNIKQENHDKKESKTVAGKANKNRPEKDFQAQETVRDEVAMVCWENSKNFWKKSLTEKQVDKMKDLMMIRENKKYDEAQEEHVDCTLNTGNKLKISIGEFSLRIEDDVSMLDTQETSQKKLVHITNPKSQQKEH